MAVHGNFYLVKHMVTDYGKKEDLDSAGSKSGVKNNFFCKWKIRCEKNFFLPDFRALSGALALRTFFLYWVRLQ